MSAPVTSTMALAPWAGAAIAEWLGAYFSMFFVLAAVNAVGVVLALWATPGFRSPPEHLSGAAVHA